MSKLFIIGNGFDISHGLKSKYSDFKNYLISKYPVALTLKEEKFDIDDYLNTDPKEYAVYLLLVTMDRASGDAWFNFEDTLAHIHFGTLIPKFIPEYEEDTKEHQDEALEYLMIMDGITGLLIESTKLWQELFQEWIMTIQKEIEYGECIAKNELVDLFSDENNKYLSFNYTKTLQTKYNVQQVTHIHNRVGQKLIFGHGDENVNYGRNDNITYIGSSFLDDMLFSLKKDRDSPRYKYKKFFHRLSEDIDEVYSYGFSYSKIDKEYMKIIVNKISKSAIWYFTEFESKNTKEIRIKKIKLRRYGFKGDFATF